MDVTKEESRRRSLMTDAGAMEWDLEVHKAVSCNTGILAGTFFQALNALESYWHGEGVKSFFRGTVTLETATDNLADILAIVPGKALCAVEERPEKNLERICKGELTE